ncbi:hypothetical protein Sjap_002254 [Stephania japonica]|uniref:Protein transport protein Sec24-like At3g07100 n=1 Tax=Stephania japonica TaxID=461633 RepID=A0AAP0KNC1_9MAGN
MQPMGNEKPGPPSFPGRPIVSPFVASPPTGMPFSSPGPVPGPTGYDASGYRNTAPARFNGPAIPPPPLPYGPPAANSYQRFPTPQFPSFAQPVPPLGGPPSSGQPTFPSNFIPGAGQQTMPPPPSYHLQPQIPSVPMGPPPPSVDLPAARANAPQSTLPGVPSMQYPYRQADPIPQVPAVQTSPFVAQRGGYAAPPLAAPMGLSLREQMQYSAGGPPMGSLQGLIEEFNSLSVGSVPGSVEPGVDSKSLPRPLDGDVLPQSFMENYPLNCDPLYFRLTTSAIPSSQSLLSRWHLPLGVVVHPLAESPNGEEVPVVNFGAGGIVRCRRCRTYVNPYVTFSESGRKWRCNICSLLNDVSGEYYAQLDANNIRIDINQRPELTKGSVEYVAPAEYMVRPPMPPLYFFLIDVSVTAVRSGMLEVVAKTIKSCLDELPGSPRTQIGFLTFDSTLHFYNMKSSLTQPQMMVVSDLDDIFVPLPDDLLVNLSESRSVVDAFLDSLPSMFQDNVNVESAFGPALKAAFMVMNRLGGKLLIFQSTLPSLGVGRLRLRGDDSRVYGTDKEPALRTPEDPFYKQMAADLTKFQIGVNVYAFSDNYTDIASLGTLAKYTGGQLQYYPSFRGSLHGERLRHELARDLTRETAWEAVMRIRCGKGVRFTTYHGNFMLRSTDLLSLPAVDCDKAFAAQFALEETLLTTQTVYFQVALLYTSSSGERRIRVHTAAAPVVTDLGDMYRQADVGAIMSLFSRLAIEKTLSYKLEDARQSVQMRIVKALKEYRNLYAVQHRLAGRLIYPESLKFLPLYGLALLKSIPLRGGFADAHLDERCATGYTVMNLPVKRLLKLLYPSLIQIDDYLVKAPDDARDGENYLRKVPLAAENLNPKGLYLYDDGLRFILWFGRMFASDIASDLLGVDINSLPDLSQINFCARENKISRKLMELVKRFREADPSNYQLCHIVRQGERVREGSLLLVNLVEDQIGGASGYVDWILQIHRQVQQSA